MRAVFINHCHPEMPHICATRVREFAVAMTARGHEVVLLTETLNGGASEISTPEVIEKIKSHDFSTPYLLACPPKGHAAINRLRQGRLPWGIRQLVILWYYTNYQGVVTNWRHGAAPYLDAIATEFKPNIIWASFGNTDCWNIARDLAAVAGCPWVADIKDPWGIFIPKLFREKLAKKYEDVAAMTCFSEMHKEEASKWFGGRKSIVYSGFKRSALTESTTNTSDELQILLTGATYDLQALNQLIMGVDQWVRGLAEGDQKRVRFLYAGSEYAVVEKATEQLKRICSVELLGYLPIDRLQSLQLQSMVNAYIKSDRTFHHKLIELLAARRPVLSFPAEVHESIKIAHSAGVPFYSCQSAGDIPEVLDNCRRDSTTAVESNDALESLSWESQAIELENVLLKEIE